MYDFQRLRLFNLYRELVQQNITVYGVATDAFFIDRKPTLPFFEGKLKYWEDFGKYQLEPKLKVPPIEPAEIAHRQTTAITTNYPPLVNSSTIQRNTFTTATIAGAGKSYSQFQFAKILPSDSDRETDTPIVIQSTKQILSTRAKVKNANVITYAQF